MLGSRRSCFWPFAVRSPTTCSGGTAKTVHTAAQHAHYDPPLSSLLPSPRRYHVRDGLAVAAQGVLGLLGRDLRHLALVHLQGKHNARPCMRVAQPTAHAPRTACLPLEVASSSPQGNRQH